MTDATAQPPSNQWPPVSPGNPITGPSIVVQEGFQGTEAEAIALAVAGAIQDIGNQRDSAQSLLETTVAKLRALVRAYPQTSFAASEAAREDAEQWLAWLDGDQPAQQT